MVNHPNRRKKRFTVRTDVPLYLKNCGIVAFVHDSLRDVTDGEAVCWFMDGGEAQAISDLLNLHGEARS